MNLRHQAFFLGALTLAAAAPASSHADFLSVPGDYASIQEAIDAAPEGAVISVAPGLYVENIDYRGKGVALFGSGPDSVIDGNFSGPVVRFVSGEGALAVLDSFTITNGLSPSGGGIEISDFAPGTVTKHNVFFRNVIAAILTAGQDFRLIRRAQVELGRERLANNIDAAPRFTEGNLPRTLEAAVPSRFVPSSDPARPSRLIGAGDPSPAFHNTDGTRNTAGFTGGPYGFPH